MTCKQMNIIFIVTPLYNLVFNPKEMYKILFSVSITLPWMADRALDTTSLSKFYFKEM